MIKPCNTILLVEANDDDADAICRSLANSNGQYRVETVSSLAEFQKKIAWFEPDLIIFDLDLPEADSAEILSPILADNKLPVLVMASAGRQADADFLLKQGALDFIVKTDRAPLDIPDMAARALREWRLIQSQRIAMAEVKQKEAMYRSVIDSQEELICRYRPDGKLSMVNDAYARYFGKSRKDLIEHNFIPNIPEPDLTEIREAMAEITRNNPVVALEHRIINPAGEVRWQQWTHRGIYDEDGGILEYQAVGRDVTERKHAEDALRSSEARYRAVFDFIGDAIMLLGTNSFIDCNKATLELFGCTRETFLSLHPGDVSPLTQPCGENSIEMADRMIALAREKGSLRFDWMHKRLDTGVPFPAEVLLCAMELDGKQIMQALVHDITERKRAEHEKEEREARERMLKKTESLKRMASAIAHNVNNLMHVIQGNLELVMRGLPADSDALGPLRDAMAAARKAAKTSEAMLCYLGATPRRTEPLDFCRLCMKALASLQPGLPKDVVLETDLSVPGPIIHGDADQIRHLLAVIVTNAGEACARGKGTIRVSVKTVAAADMPGANFFHAGWQPPAAPHACLEISDTGRGIASSDFDKIFDPFFSTRSLGRGMGLPAALGIVRAHAGGIALNSAPGKGCTFRVFLPVSSPPVTHPRTRK